jgi:hypothetical protein
MFSDKQLAEAHLERDRLVRDCISLIHRISRKPYYLKLLYGAKYSLEVFLDYKGTRKTFSNRNEERRAA